MEERQSPHPDPIRSAPPTASGSGAGRDTAEDGGRLSALRALASILARQAAREAFQAEHPLPANPEGSNQ